VRPYLEKPFTKIGLVEWLKVKPLSSGPSAAKTKEWSKHGDFILPNQVHCAANS
jgi:hypothetical protein